MKMKNIEIEMKNIEFFSLPGIEMLGYEIDGERKPFSEFPADWVNIIYARFFDYPNQLKACKLDGDDKSTVVQKFLIRYFAKYDKTVLDIDENGNFNFEEMDVVEFKTMWQDSLTELIDEWIAREKFARQKINQFRICSALISQIPN